MNFKKLHYFSGITISVFIGIHLVNHGLSLLGAQAHIDFMNEIRVVYRNTIVESILLLAVLIQIISGIKLFFTKRKSSTSFFDTLQVWTGLYLAFFFVVHIGAILFGRLILHLDTNFYFGIAGLNTYPLNLFFIPYYAFAITSIFGHVSAVHSKKMKATIFGLNPAKQAYGILALGIIATFVLIYGLCNGFTGFTIPSEYEIMIGK